MCTFDLLISKSGGVCVFFCFPVIACTQRTADVQAGFECTALTSAELYDPTTKSFSPAGCGSTKLGPHERRLQGGPHGSQFRPTTRIMFVCSSLQANIISRRTRPERRNLPGIRF